MPVPEALDALRQEEEQKLVDMDSVARAAVERVQQAGIIFLDEIDKVAGREGGHGPDVSREGVQRDILPIVEGTTVNTKYGMVKTDHILFIAAGAFHVSKPSDLIPELQGRFPIRVELEPLGREDFVRILTEPKNALVRQYTALLATEGVTLTFTPDSIERLADVATLVNERTENIGARRLHTVMEKLLDNVSFDAPDLRRQGADASTPPTSTACSAKSRATKICRDISCSDVAHCRHYAPRIPRLAPRASRFESAALVASLALLAACGKKGPPLAPLNMAPEAPAAIVARRLGDTVYLQMTVPAKSATGTGAYSVDHLDVYAVTLAPGTVTAAEPRFPQAGARDREDRRRAAARSGRAASRTTPETRPHPGDMVTFVETLTPAALEPQVITKPPKAEKQGKPSHRPRRRRARRSPARPPRRRRPRDRRC